MGMMKWAAVVVLGGALAVIGAGQLGGFQGTAPNDLGVRAGRLKPPSMSDNSVSSQASLHRGHPRQQAAQMAPLAIRGDGPATLAKIESVVQSMPGARVVTREADYLYAQFTTPLMGFVDDVEFWFDPVARVIQVRSASRIGESDLGLNRRRIEAVRAALATAP